MIDRRFGRLTDPPASFILVGARVIDPASGADATRDLAVRDGIIVSEAGADLERIPADGLVVAPGFCDLHTHLREPGTEGETIASGSRAAARGGFTTVCAMPNTDPAPDDASGVEGTLAAARQASCRVRVIGAATRGRASQHPSDLAGLHRAGVVGVSDDGAAVPDEELARQILASLAGMGIPLIEHAEDPSVPGRGVMRAGPAATRLGLPGWPPEAELRIVERDLRLAAETGARLHLTHLSTSAAIHAVRRAKERGLAVTCDVTPHHLAMTDDWVAGSRRFAWADPEQLGVSAAAYDGATRVNPPLASRQDALALCAALADGTIDAIATDHAPHPPHRKAVPFADAAPGLIGLETALSLGLAAMEAGRLELRRLLSALSTEPAAIIGERRALEPGVVADLVAFDPSRRWTVEPHAFASTSTNTPLLGMELPGVVRLTVAEGRITHRS